MEQEDFSVGRNSFGLSGMTSQAAHCAGAYFPCQVVEMLSGKGQGD